MKATTKSTERPYRLVTAAACMLAIACGPSTEVRSFRETHALIDLQALAGTRVSVADTVILGIAQANGDSQRLVRQLGPGDSVVTFDVRVESGTVRFTGSVRSNNGTLLYRGRRQVAIEVDGFQVAIAETAFAPVLVVFPDSILLHPADSASLSLQNRGLGTSVWRLSTSPTTPCPSPDSLSFSADSGRIPANSSAQVVARWRFASMVRTTLCVLHFTDSLAGHVDVKAVAQNP